MSGRDSELTAGGATSSVSDTLGAMKWLRSEVDKDKPIPVAEADTEFSEAEHNLYTERWEKLRSQLAKSTTGVVLNPMEAHTKPMTMEPSPIVETPYEWQAVQQLCLTLSGNMFDTGKDPTMTQVSRIQTSNPASRAAKRLILFWCGVFHDLISKPSKEKPAKPKKRKGGKGAKDGEEEPEEIPEPDLALQAAMRDSFTAAAGDRTQPTFMCNLMSDPSTTFAVPRVGVYFETLFNSTADTCGVRAYFTVYDPEIDLDRAAEEYMARSDMRWSVWKEARERQETTSGGKTRGEQKPFASDSDHTAYLHLRTKEDWARAISDYYEPGHPVHELLRDPQQQEAILHPDNTFHTKRNPATPTAVLTAEHGFRRKVVGLCAEQSNIEAYRAAVSGYGFVHRFPLPFNVSFVGWSDLDPQALHGSRLPSTTGLHVFRSTMKSQLNDAYGASLACTPEIFEKVQRDSASSDPLVHGMAEMSKLSATRPDLKTPKDLLAAMDIVENLKPDIMNRRRRIERQHEPGTPEYCRAMSTFKREVTETVWSTLFQFETVMQFLSPTSISALRRIAEHDPSEHWGDWKTPAQDLDPHGAALLNLHMQMTHLYRIKEGAPQRDMLFGLFAALTACHHHYGLKVNVLGINSNSTGKSFRLQLTERVCLPGSVLRASHMTMHALNVQGNFNYRVYVIEELEPSFVGIGAGGTRTESPQQNFLKNVLTAQQTRTVQCTMTDTGERVQTQPLSSAICSFAAAMNTPAAGNTQGEGRSAEFSRWVVSMPSPAFETTVQLRDLVAKLHDEGDDGLISEFESEMHMFHSLVVITNMLIGMGVFHPVNNDLGNMTMRILNQRLKAVGYPQMDPRLMEQAAELMIAICIWCAVNIMTASEISLIHCFDEHGDYRPVGADLLLKLEPLLVVNTQHVMFALTLLAPNIIPMAERVIRGTLPKLDIVRSHGPYMWRENDGTVYWDPRKLILPCTLDQLTRHIREAIDMDVTEQQIKQVLTGLRSVNCEGEGLASIELGDARNRDLDAALELAKSKSAGTKWSIPVVEVCNNPALLGVGRGARGAVALTKTGIDFENRGEAFLHGSGDDELARMISSIFSTYFTHERRLVTAGVLRDAASGQVYQRALGVVRIGQADRAFVFGRTTHVGKADRIACYSRTRDANTARLGTNTTPVIKLGADPDEVMLAVHYAEIGGNWHEFQAFLPWSMMEWRRKIRQANPNIFAVPGKEQPFNEYAAGWIEAFEEEKRFRERQAKARNSAEDIIAEAQDRTTRIMIPGADYFERMREALGQEEAPDAPSYFSTSEAERAMASLPPAKRQALLHGYTKERAKRLRGDVVEHPLTGGLQTEHGLAVADIDRLPYYVNPKQANRVATAREEHLRATKRRRDGAENGEGGDYHPRGGTPKRPRDLSELFAEGADEDVAFN